MYYSELFYSNQCKEIKKKKEPVSFIESGYLDGSCIKD